VSAVPLFLVALVPVVLGILLALRARQERAAAAADLAAYARERGFAGSTDPLALRGEVDGAPCYVGVDVVGEGKQARLLLRARVLAGEPSAYRDGRGGAPAALAIGRNESVPTDRVAGLHEISTGDAGFDAAYRTFVAPGTDAPWRDATLRGAMRSLEGRLVRAERGPAACSVAFAPFSRRGAHLAKAVAIAASLAGADRARRHHADLAAPLDPAGPVEERRVAWALGRWLTVSIVGFLAAWPLIYVPPVQSYAESIACRPGERLTTVGVTNGRGVTFVCSGPRGRHGAAGWLLLVGADAGFVLVLVAFSAFELAVRARRAAR
jgi:hypothetical protein